MLIKQGLYRMQSNYREALMHFLKLAGNFQSYIASNETL